MHFESQKYELNWIMEINQTSLVKKGSFSVDFLFSQSFSRVLLYISAPFTGLMLYKSIPNKLKCWNTLPFSRISASSFENTWIVGLFYGHILLLSPLGSILATSMAEKGIHYKDFSPVDVASIRSPNPEVK